MKKLLLSFLLLSSSASYGSETSSNVKNGLLVSTKIVIGAARGSGAAIAHHKGGTLVLTNDHVCQYSRGAAIVDGEVTPDYDKKLNTVRPFVIRISEDQHMGLVVYTSNSTNPERKGKFEDDLCLIYIGKKIPIATLNKKDPDIGTEILSISAPHGIFPLISRGFVGAWATNDIGTTSVLVGPGSSGSAIFSYKTGRLLGTIFAIKTTGEGEMSALLSYFIPVMRAKLFLDSYLEKQRQ